MFEITVNGQTLYHPSSVDCTVTNAVIHEGLNDVGYMEVTIPFSNPLFNSLQERKGKVIVYKDNVAMWYGEIRDISIDFSKNKTLYVVGEASYLNDTVQPLKEIKGSKYQIFQEIINHHNSMVETEKEFQAGMIGRNADKIMDVVTNWQYSLDAIRELLCEEEEYVRIRHVNNVRYIDIMPIDSFGKHSDQDIMFGDNLLDYAEDSSGQDIATICIPLGARLDESSIEGYESYVTCENANAGKNYVELQGAINNLGRITKVVNFDEVTDATELVNLAINYLQAAQYATLTLNLSAVDLSILHNDIDNYSVGDYVHAICEPMGMNAWFPVRERETDLINLANNNIKIGAVGIKSFTSQQIENIANIEKIMPKRDSILDAAKRNASALINGAGKNGHVVLHENADGVVYEILIMDTPDINTASKIWRWNENGFGYADSKDESGNWEFGTAITMDGSIVADYITTGQMNCDLLNGGTINGQRIVGGSIEGATFKQETNTGNIRIEGGWIYGTSGKDAGSAIELTGNNNNALYGSYWVRAYNGSAQRQIPLYDIIEHVQDSSDIRLKENINKLRSDISKKLIDNTEVYEFNFKDRPNKKQFGVIAQEIKEVIEECGYDSENVGMVYLMNNPIEAEKRYKVEYDQLIPHLMNYVKDLQNQINELKKGAKND